ncbi:leucoanthocyanidin dioxygenase [Mytilinidion resinicola]|uniref:Leucoanthocyanidin dioxygenase n=1 Tax=Mytilinidion resinicola TaxID=574789 RepID=A0A6A6YAF9_9PEZI|nr:leucoanthocyanidin dioxygenase [Mytilinidion resinicola]KAF2805609.1 leucoanthocyanidin dioxygenase [Mytilinidion resinicola]
MAAKTTYRERAIPRISLSDFENNIDAITAQLCDASENVGFFSIVDHGISIQEIEDMFAQSQSFFALPDDVKATVPWSPNNVGWEKNSQIRPSTGAPDTKESYQLQFGSYMNDTWISPSHLPEFKEKSLAFMNRVRQVSELLMICFARGLGFPDDYFIKLHDVSRENVQSVLRLLHYFELPEVSDGKVYHRAGAHADWGFLTLLFQREGQSGLEICPGREVVTEFAQGDTWSKVHLEAGDIVCNIGDLLMSWSDDRFKSTFHRVKAPCEPGDYFGPRYSMAYFNQPCSDAVIQGPKKKYPPVTGAEFTASAMKRNFAVLAAKRQQLEEEDLKAKSIAPTTGTSVAAGA